MSRRDILELPGHEAVAEWFSAARESLPGQKLTLNDFDLVGNGDNAKRREGIIALVRDLQNSEAPPISSASNPTSGATGSPRQKKFGRSSTKCTPAPASRLRQGRHTCFSCPDQ